MHRAERPAIASSHCVDPSEDPAESSIVTFARSLYGYVQIVFACKLSPDLPRSEQACESAAWSLDIAKVRSASHSDLCVSCHHHTRDCETVTRVQQQFGWPSTATGSAIPEGTRGRYTKTRPRCLLYPAHLVWLLAVASTQHRTDGLKLTASCGAMLQCTRPGICSPNSQSSKCTRLEDSVPSWCADHSSVQQSPHQRQSLRFLDAYSA